MFSGFATGSNKRDNGIKLNIDLKGLGVSIVDKEPKELMYLSIFRIHVEGIRDVKKQQFGVTETENEYKLKIYHVQIDNMTSIENPLLLSPYEVIDKKKIYEDKDYVPFIQVAATFSTSEYGIVSKKKFDALQLMIQKFKIEIETGTVMIIVNNITEIADLFTDSKTEYASAQAKKIKENNQRSFDENQDKHVSNSEIKMTDIRLNEESYLPSSKRMEEFKKKAICPELDTASPIPPDLSSINTDKLFFKMIHLGAIRIDITLKFEKKSLNFDVSQGFGALTLLYTLFTSIANMSDAPLSFREMMLTDVFQSQSSLISMIIKNIVRQAIFQFYKLIGSSDLLGNPVGFVSKLGSGVFELFNEPRKGLLKGPKEFVGGIGKGVTSLMTSVVSASFGSASKITGSFYTMFKSMSGQPVRHHK